MLSAQLRVRTLVFHILSGLHFISFRLLKYTKDRTPAVTAATGVLVTYK